MSKPKSERALGDKEAQARASMMRISAQKLNLVAQTIRGKKAEAALNELSFSNKRIAGTVKKVLQSAIANAENNHDLDVDSLVVTEASVGKNMVMKRFHARARGRGAAIEKFFSQITIVVEELKQEAAAKKAKGKKKPAAKKAAPKKTKTAEAAPAEENA